MLKKASWIRTVYLYLVSMTGLVIVVIGGIMLIQLLLKIFIFTNADKDMYNSFGPQPLYMERTKAVQDAEAIRDCSEKCAFTEDEKALVLAWLDDYQKWSLEQQNVKVDQRIINRERQASQAIAMILIGLPVWLYHWSVIKRDKKREDAEESHNA